jgi:hypothetical protein
MAEPFETITSQPRRTPGDRQLESDRGFVGALIASGPAPQLAEKLDLFGQLVGSWDVHLISHRPDPILPEQVECEWHFGWVLGGRAIQDVWIAPKRALRNKRNCGGEWGTMIRFYDKSIDAWRCTWHGPSRGVVRPFRARTIDDRIVLEGVFPDEGPLRWIFSEITDDSFHWRSVVSSDHWETEELIQEMFAHRQAGSRQQ